MYEDILEAANLYEEGLRNVLERREKWIESHKVLKEYLLQVAAFLNSQSPYKQNYYVDSLRAYNEEINGACAELPSLSLRSSEMPMHVVFKNVMGESRELTEDGFRITFMPSITGQVIVLLFPHRNELSKSASDYVTVAVIDDPAQLTPEIAGQIIARCIKVAFSSSFTGATGQTAEAAPQQLPVNSAPHNIIGFKRYETTEKVS